MRHRSPVTWTTMVVKRHLQDDFDQVGPLVLHAVLKLIIEFLSGRRAHCLYPHTSAKRTKIDIKVG